ncbi:hypothetical protein BD310DRAFT_941927 [Dichomitus squalens]|uniref:Uncharacterized protein n=1 Tax=Dichomitus squalens TaxID=114155 RepID=A0A4V2K6D9_9APHY|nr:hypothetical protein BD310DRAFT_941927 [Dichomitus squalens]
MPSLVSGAATTLRNLHGIRLVRSRSSCRFRGCAAPLLALIQTWTCALPAVLNALCGAQLRSTGLPLTTTYPNLIPVLETLEYIR